MTRPTSSRLFLDCTTHDWLASLVMREICLHSWHSLAFISHGRHHYMLEAAPCRESGVGDIVTTKRRLSGVQLLYSDGKEALIFFWVGFIVECSWHVGFQQMEFAQVANESSGREHRAGKQRLQRSRLDSTRLDSTMAIFGTSVL